MRPITDYAIYMLDANGIVSSWNPGARRFKGYDASEIVGEHFSRFYTEADRASGLPQRALEPRPAKENSRARDGGVARMAPGSGPMSSSTRSRMASGNVVGYAKITRDLTERRQAEEQLRRSEEQFRRLVQGVTDYAIYMLTPEGLVSSWNAGAQRIKGYARRRNHRAAFLPLLQRAGPARGRPAIWRSKRPRETAGSKRKAGACRKDGSKFMANVVIDPIRADDGTLLGFAKITRDITERRKTERALQETREALFQSQKMDAIGQLTGGVAHDFNNLLMAVLGSLELLRKRLPDDPRTIRLVDNAMHAAQRGAGLTQRMLAFARRQELKPVVLDVADLVRGMTDLLHSSLGATAQIRMEFALRAEQDSRRSEPAGTGHPQSRRQCAGRDAERRLDRHHREEETIAGAADLKDGNYVCLSVSDNGCGMDEATRRRALEPFFTTKGVGKGTGLGLSMVHGMIQQSGGRFVLRSSKGEGTTVELWLPVADGPDHVRIDAAPKPSNGKEGPLRILAVDDDALVLLNTAAMLEDLGHTVLEATSGSSALEIIRRDDTIDLVITDQAMPHMTGSDLAAAIRVEKPDLPIILATGFAELPPGADEGLPKLSKPFLQQQLADAIAKTVVV